MSENFYCVVVDVHCGNGIMLHLGEHLMAHYGNGLMRRAVGAALSSCAEVILLRKIRRMRKI